MSRIEDVDYIPNNSETLIQSVWSNWYSCITWVQMIPTIALVGIMTVVVGLAVMFDAFSISCELLHYNYYKSHNQIVKSQSCSDLEPSKEWIVMVVGGWTGNLRINDVQRFGISKDGTRLLTHGRTMPYGVADAMASTIIYNDNIYVIGAVVDFPDNTQIHETNYVASFNLTSNTWSWSNQPKLTTPRRWATSFVLDKTVCIVGGKNNNGKVTSMECLDQDGWITQGPHLPVHRKYLASVTLGGYAWVSNPFYRWKLGMDLWEPRAPMKKDREAHAMTTDGKYIFAIGGSWETSVEKYDPVMDYWSELSPLPVWRSRSAVVYIPDLDTLVLPGGRGPYTDTSTTHEAKDTIFTYNITKNRWSLSDVQLAKAVDAYGVVAVPGTKSMFLNGK